MTAARRFLVTGGAGFIGSAVVRHLIAETPHEVAVVDKLTYAGNRASLAPVEGEARFRFHQYDIADARRMAEVIAVVRPDVVMHLAAESHVDRSIDGAGDFIQTNLVGTYVMLEAARAYHAGLTGAERDRFRFHHVSTDEVFGSADDGDFTEDTPYRPNSPYSATKAGSDHLVRAWHRTYGLPVVVSNCSNNYGPYQFPEKLIPLMILNCMAGESLPVYGTGNNERDWLHVQDHVAALLAVAERGKIGETYLIGAGGPVANIDIVRSICALMDRRLQRAAPSEALIAFVADRPGHDLRYAVDTSRIRNELGWQPRETFASGLAATVDWYLANEAWWRPLREARYRGERLGVAR